MGTEAVVGTTRTGIMREAGGGDEGGRYKAVDRDGGRVGLKG